MVKSKLSKQKMNGEERKLSIVKSAIPIFAEKGFHGTTVKSIAKAAGISEALLYQHFSSKEEIYLSIGKHNEAQLFQLIEVFREREPGTKTLVELVYCIIMIIVSDIHGKSELQHAFSRFFAYSILENVDFTRYVFFTIKDEMAPLWDRSMTAARENGDLRENYRTRNSMWLIHHLVMIIDFLNLAGNKVYDYEGTYDDFIEDVLQLALIGTGIKEEAIERYYKPAELKKLLKGIFRKE